jgi:hypothetical protein
LADLDPFAFEILKFFFNQSRDLSTKEVATQFSMPVGVAEFHTDTLRERSLIELTRHGISIESGMHPALFAITSAGRKYVMERR